MIPRRGSLKPVIDNWKFRRRMAVALRGAAPNALATPDELDSLVAMQTAYWERNPPLAAGLARQVLRDLNHRSRSVVIFSVNGRNVRMWPKDEFFSPTEEGSRRCLEQQLYLQRARFYQAFIQGVLGRGRFEHSFEFALDLEDIPADSTDLPIFGFQKIRGAHNLLFPDVDFFVSKWYRRDPDFLLYEEKINSACFVGSSTGAWLDVESIRNHGTPRLRAAAYFLGNPRVSFRIANVVQCLTEEAKALLMSQSYYVPGHVRWKEQLRHRFLISMDGNGATCSRLVKGLRSNSVVVKFASPYELYYFPALTPGREYLLAEKEEDVERFIESEVAEPGTFKQVAESGQRFAEKYLTIRSVVNYTSRLLAAFAALSPAD